MTKFLERHKLSKMPGNEASNMAQQIKVFAGQAWCSGSCPWIPWEKGRIDSRKLFSDHYTLWWFNKNGPQRITYLNVTGEWNSSKGSRGVVLVEEVCHER